MAQLQLTFACDNYEQLRALREGRVQAEGLDLTFVNVSGATRHGNMYRDQAYDISELSFSTYLVARSQDTDWLQAIPFFTRRLFCQGFWFVRPGSGIETPADLRGRRFGLGDWETTAALMTKGILAHDYGVPLEDVTWVCAGTETALGALPTQFRIERSDKNLEQLLAEGAIDAAVHNHPPHSWQEGQGVERLFPNFVAEEQTHFQQTGIFPIMHTIALKREILDREPWVAANLYGALVESRRIALAEAPEQMPSVWGPSHVEEEQRLFGRDPFVQGIKENRHDVQTMIQYADEQGMLARPLTIEELFAGNMLST